MTPILCKIAGGLALAGVAGVAWAALVAPWDGASETRRFTFQYETIVGPVESGAGPVDVFVPLARSSGQQRVVEEQIVASIPGRVRVEESYGNRYWHGHVESSDGQPIEVRITTTVVRIVSRLQAPVASRSVSEAERDRLAPFLRSNSRVVVGHPILDPIRAEIRELAGSDDPAALSRAIYDWVVDNVEYKKVGRGWGNGDTFWACRERAGNCTDFHALFISLARSEGIPARFEIGFPVPEDRESGKIDGYHCWVQFYLPEVGWFPIDASEAFKHPEKRNHFYGAHPGDRIALTIGRDLALGEGHRDRPLNYFVYPYVEVGGTAWSGSVERSFSYAATGQTEPR